MRFPIFIEHKDVVERVTFWGLSDRRTWRVGQHPLIFDSNNQRKLAYVAIVDALLHPATHGQPSHRQRRQGTPEGIAPRDQRSQSHQRVTGPVATLTK
jgi:hypothetical protein